MPGLDGSLVKNLDFQRSLNRILTDTSTDFIPAPHYLALYSKAGGDLSEFVRSALSSGRFEPQLPVTIEVPKKSGLTRPGAILHPPDRVVYQMLADETAPVVESQLNRSRVFSNVLRYPDVDNQMFEDQSLAYRDMMQVVTERCTGGEFPYVIRADVASFFERLYQHNLINLLHSSGVMPELVGLLEKLLLAWMDKNSHGIVQGVFPSDLFGNYYLCGLDAEFEIREIPSVRFVDDMYLFFSDLKPAREALIALCAHLRKEGLNLNESKTAILDAKRLMHEETEIDRLFADARQEVESFSWTGVSYGWQVDFPEPDILDEMDVETEALHRLFDERESQPVSTREKIDAFCLPWFAAIGSDAGVNQAFEGLQSSPHMTRIYCNYLSALAQRDSAVTGLLEDAFLAPLVHTDWQLLWPATALINAPGCKMETVNEAIRILRDLRHSEAVRAICGVVVAKHGTAAQRRTLRHHYPDEPSPYVRSALLYSTRYYPSTERNTCLTSWGGHSTINSLMVRAVKELVK